MEKDKIPNDSFNWRKVTITQQSLLSKELEPLDYLVEGLIITPGLAVLAGNKKIGKSWMTLQLAQCIASGSPFLGRATSQGNVVYLALEDGENRLQLRLNQQGANAELPIRYSCRWPALNSIEGLEALGDIIKNKTPVLVVIDTLASARDKRAKENESDSMGELFNALHIIAVGLNTVIFIVAHHGKKRYGDVGFDIRGSSAIAGATDTNIGLYKNSDGTFSLKAEGRDITEVDLRVKFDAEITWAWQCLGDDRDIRRVEAENRIIEVIDTLGEAYAPDIAKELGVSRPTIYTHLKRMTTEGRVEYRVIETKSGSKKSYYLPQKTGATSPTRLPGKPVRGSRGNNQPGDDSSKQEGGIEAKSSGASIGGYTITDEEVSELMKRLRGARNGDVTQLISEYFIDSQ